jgi:hypothetical protein
MESSSEAPPFGAFGSRAYASGGLAHRWPMAQGPDQALRRNQSFSQDSFAKANRKGCTTIMSGYNFRKVRYLLLAAGSRERPENAPRPIL